MANMIKVLFINNDGGGFADWVEVAEGMTVEQLFQEKMGEDAKATNFLIRVDRQPASGSDALRDGQRVSFTPTKVEGAT